MYNIAIREEWGIIARPDKFFDLLFLIISNVYVPILYTQSDHFVRFGPDTGSVEIARVF